jgi:hypothetical protein
MKILVLENKSISKPLIYESFGLSNSGKTTYLKSLIAKGYKCSLASDNAANKVFPLIKFILKHPRISFKLFLKLNSSGIRLKHLDFLKYFKIAIMRNSYLSAVFAKYEQIKEKHLREEIYVDEFFLQSIPMIIQLKSNKKEISKIMELFPKSKRFLLAETDKKVRYERLNKNGFPGENIDKKYSRVWMENSEFNYSIVKKILLEKYELVDQISL